MLLDLKRKGYFLCCLLFEEFTAVDGLLIVTALAVSTEEVFSDILADLL